MILQNTYSTWEEYVDWYFRWTVNWHDCNAFCVGFLVFDYLNLIAHWGINMIQLRGWAEGNFLLLANTWYTTVMTLFATMLTLGVPSLMMAPYSTRIGIFSFALVTLVSFTVQSLGLVVHYFRGTNPYDSFSEIVSMYVTILQFGAYVPSLYIVLFDGLAFSPYALFNRHYPKNGDWSHVKIRPKASASRQD